MEISEFLPREGVSPLSSAIHSRCTYLFQQLTLLCQEPVRFTPPHGRAATLDGSSAGMERDILHQQKDREEPFPSLGCCVPLFYHYLHTAYLILTEQSFKASKTSWLPSTELIYVVCTAVVASSGRKEILHYPLFRMDEMSRLPLS